MTLHAYFFNLCLNIVPSAYAWTLVSQETEKFSDMRMIAFIITGRGADFILECNKTWFSIGETPIRYDAFAVVFIGLVVLKATIDEQRL
jgi:hypothetical protein